MTNKKWGITDDANFGLGFILYYNFIEVYTLPSVIYTSKANTHRENVDQPQRHSKYKCLASGQNIICLTDGHMRTRMSSSHVSPPYEERAADRRAIQLIGIRVPGNRYILGNLFVGWQLWQNITILKYW